MTGLQCEEQGESETAYGDDKSFRHVSLPPRWVATEMKAPLARSLGLWIADFRRRNIQLFEESARRASDGRCGGAENSQNLGDPDRGWPHLGGFFPGSRGWT
jgi:hypothetical protein